MEFVGFMGFLLPEGEDWVRCRCLALLRVGLRDVVLPLLSKFTFPKATSLWRASINIQTLNNSLLRAFKYCVSLLRPLTRGEFAPKNSI